MKHTSIKTYSVTELGGSGCMYDEVVVDNFNHGADRAVFQLSSEIN